MRQPVTVFVKTNIHLHQQELTEKEMLKVMSLFLLFFFSLMVMKLYSPSREFTFVWYTPLYTELEDIRDGQTGYLQPQGEISHSSVIHERCLFK